MITVLHWWKSGSCMHHLALQPLPPRGRTACTQGQDWHGRARLSHWGTTDYACGGWRHSSSDHAATLSSPNPDAQLLPEDSAAICEELKLVAFCDAWCFKIAQNYQYTAQCMTRENKQHQPGVGVHLQRMADPARTPSGFSLTSAWSLKVIFL